MTDLRESQEGLLPFYLYDLDWHRLGDKVQGLVEDGTLPFDSLFRLAAVGHCERDPTVVDGEFSNRLIWNILNDIAVHDGDKDALRPDTCELLWGERPDAIVDWYTGSNHPAYPQLDPMYYDMADLARIIYARRKEEGKTITEVPRGSWYDPEEQESHRCFGLARPIWRVIVRRIHPEWMDNPADYYAPTIRFNQVYYASEAAQRRRIVGHAVISDTVVFSLYKEATESGIKGVGPVGREDLRTMLAEEHPELY